MRFPKEFIETRFLIENFLFLFPFFTQNGKFTAIIVVINARSKPCFTGKGHGKNDKGHDRNDSKAGTI